MYPHILVKILLLTQPYNLLITVNAADAVPRNEYATRVRNIIYVVRTAIRFQ